MFLILDERVEMPISNLKQQRICTFLCGGIVNPFGPTLTAVALMGEQKAGRTCDLIEIMLNPFSQAAYLIGRATIKETWSALADYEPLFEIPYGSCPTLVFPSYLLTVPEAIEVHTRWLMGFPDGRKTWENIQKHPRDPWTRVKEDVQVSSPADVNAGEARNTGNNWLSDTQAREFATFILSKDHIVSEIQAFKYAWKGSIDFQRKEGNTDLASHALGREAFTEWISLIVASCRVPGSVRPYFRSGILSRIFW